MVGKRLFIGFGLVTALVIPLVACFGDVGGGKGSSQGADRMTVSPSHPSIPAGGGGIVTVTVSRYLSQAPRILGPLTLSLDQAPAGVTGSGSIAANLSTGTLSLLVEGSVTPRTIQGLRVKAAGGGTMAVAVFDLTVAPPLPSGQIRADLVQASGGAQRGGNLVNTPVVQEPVAATTASDAAKFEAARHGFHPSTPSN